VPLEVIARDGQKINVERWPVFQKKETPWLLEIWEPLTTKVPNPNLVQPHCCYINTVIFYARPHVVRPWHHFWRSGATGDLVLVCAGCGKQSSSAPCQHCGSKQFVKREGWPGRWQVEKPGLSYEEYGRVDTVLSWDSVFPWNGEEFIIGGGTVVWKNKRWWMKRCARRRKRED
jgi:hypothetical protein